MDSTTPPDPALCVVVFLDQFDLHVKYSRHRERSKAIHDFAALGLPRYARSDGRVFMLWGGFVAMGAISFLDRYDINVKYSRHCERSEAKTCRIDIETESGSETDRVFASRFSGVHRHVGAVDQGLRGFAICGKHRHANRHPHLNLGLGHINRLRHRVNNGQC